MARRHHKAKVERSFFESIPMDEKLRLRDDVMPHARKREWLFKGFDSHGNVLLCHEIDEYIWEALPEYIDWEEYRARELSRVEPRKEKLIREIEKSY